MAKKKEPVVPNPEIISILEMMEDVEREAKKISNTCQHKNTRMSMTYDAVYCLDCREWLETKCESPECDQCRGRPPTAPWFLDKKEEELLRSG